MKNISFLLFILFGITTSAQSYYGALFDATDLKCDKKFKNETLLVPQGFSEEIDEALKYAVVNYWDVSPYRFIHKETLSEVKGTYISIYVDDNKDGLDPFYHNSTYLYFSSPAGMSCRLYFDNDYKNTNNVVVGIDSDYKAMSYKIIQYLMLLNSEIKRMQKDVGRYFYNKDIKIENMKGYKFLVAEEYLNEELLKEDFLAKISCEFLPAEKIAEKLKEKRLPANQYGQILLSKGLGWVRLYVIDLNSGNLLYYDKIRSSIGKKIKSKDIRKLLKDLE